MLKSENVNENCVSRNVTLQQECSRFDPPLGWSNVWSLPATLNRSKTCNQLKGTLDNFLAHYATLGCLTCKAFPSSDLEKTLTVEKVGCCSSVLPPSYV